MAEMNYTVHEQLNLIELRPIGEVSVEDICTYGNSLVDKGIVRDGTIEYVDMTDVTGLIVSYASARDLVGFLGRWQSAGWFGSVYYTPKDVQFGIIRMLRAVVECILDSPTSVWVRLPKDLIYVPRTMNSLGQRRVGTIYGTRSPSSKNGPIVSSPDMPDNVLH